MNAVLHNLALKIKYNPPRTTIIGISADGCEIANKNNLESNQ